jgi:hypothetical protein
MVRISTIRESNAQGQRLRGLVAVFVAFETPERASLASLIGREISDDPFRGRPKHGGLVLAGGTQGALGSSTLMMFRLHMVANVHKRQ